MRNGPGNIIARLLKSWFNKLNDEFDEYIFERRKITARIEAALEIHTGGRWHETQR